MKAVRKKNIGYLRTLSRVAWPYALRINLVTVAVVPFDVSFLANAFRAQCAVVKMEHFSRRTWPEWKTFCILLATKLAQSFV
jgi:hypothetical protein